MVLVKRAPLKISQGHFGFGLESHHFVGKKVVTYWIYGELWQQWVWDEFRNLTSELVGQEEAGLDKAAQKF